jgi:cytidine deaminase
MASHRDLTRALSRINLPAAAQRRLGKIFTSSACPSAIPSADAHAVAAEAHLSSEQLMIKLLPVAQQFSVAPISKFHVGAISRGASGGLYMGANMEFVGDALSFCTHGEQAATVNAWLHGEDGITELAITDPPCGYCRQFLYELFPSGALVILLPGRPTVRLAPLLPMAFGPHDLGVRGGMMQRTHNGLSLEHATNDPVIQAALSAANASYAPYSRGYAGVALATRGGRAFAGRYAENAAYNPSMSPMEAALAHLNLCGASYGDVVRAVLVQARPSGSSQVDASTAVFRAVSKVKLEVVYARAPGRSASQRTLLGKQKISQWARLLGAGLSG